MFDGFKAFDRGTEPRDPVTATDRRDIFDRPLLQTVVRNGSRRGVVELPRADVYEAFGRIGYAFGRAGDIGCCGAAGVPPRDLTALG